MKVKNFTSSNLVFNGKGSSIVLTANETTLIPDGITTIAELQQLFGKQSVALDSSASVTTSILTNQQVVATGKLYCTEPIDQVEDIRIWIEGASATVDIYGSDSNTPPSALSAMSCPTGNTGVSGLCSVACLPRYIAFKVNAGTPTVIVTNLKLHEVSSIA